MQFCIFNNVYHHIQCFYRVFTVSSLSGQHNCICSIIYCISNVSYLCSGWSWITDHGIQHLCSNNNRFVIIITFLDNLLLQIRDFLRRNLNPKIASGYHNTICTADDLVDIIHTFSILYLGDNRNIRCATFLQPCLDLKNTFCISYK